MKHFSIFLFLSLLLHSDSFAFEKWKPARIKDKDGYVYVRKGAGQGFEVVGKILSDEFFYCLPSDSDWWRINDESGLEGYMHRSRIVLLENLSVSDKKKLFLKIFREEQQLADSSIVIYNARGNSKWESESDSLRLHKAYLKFASFQDKKFVPVIRVFPMYFCDTKDSTLMNLCLSILWANPGSANETIGTVLGKCFYCNPDLIIRMIKRRPREEYHEFLDMIEVGLELTIPYFEKSTDPRVVAARNKLNELNSK
ncbi:MAG TPA: SH3 domain-containing protein [Chitinophagales bacterium]|nr:SH3 domain-containing protein [Chitinophagales bacterium]